MTDLIKKLIMKMSVCCHNVREGGVYHPLQMVKLFSFKWQRMYLSPESKHLNGGSTGAEWLPHGVVHNWPLTLNSKTGRQHKELWSFNLI